MNNQRSKNKSPSSEIRDGTPEDVSLGFLFWNFLKIGSVSFGGFMALISVIEDVIVRRLGLMAHEDMLDGISLANLLPGPQAVNVVAFVGYRLRKGPGALICATAVLIPSFLLMTVLSYLYFTCGTRPAVTDFLRGFAPAVTAIILSVAWRMGKQHITGRLPAFIAVTTALLILFIRNIYLTVSVIALAALIGRYYYRHDDSTMCANGDDPNNDVPFPLKSCLLISGMIIVLVALFLMPLPIADTGLSRLAITFSGLSVMLFGGGYVFIPMIQDVVVNTYQWVSMKEFIDGIALGQVTPGPILISAAFIGQKVMMDAYGIGMSIAGALISTAAVFAPPAIIMVGASQALDWLKQSGAVKAAMGGIRCAVIGMIAAAGCLFGIKSVPHPPPEMIATAGHIFTFAASPEFWKEFAPSLLIFLGSMAALLRYEIQVVWIIPAAGLVGLILY